jgi:hypothetical protein
MTKEIAANSVFNKKKDTVKIITNEILLLGGDNSIVAIKKSKKDQPENHLKSKEIAVSYGFLNLTSDSGSFDPFDKDSKMRVGNSHSFEIQSRRERQLGDYTSPFFIRYGLAYRSDTYMPKRPLVFSQNNENLYLVSRLLILLINPRSMYLLKFMETGSPF